MMRTKYIFITASLVSLIVFVAITPNFAWAQDSNNPPFISNVHAEQRSETKLVDIIYDVSDPDGDLLTIIIKISDDDGITFTVPAMTFTGDIGSRVIPGKGKHIVWDAGADIPGVIGANFRIKIIASDVQIDKTSIIGRDGLRMVLVPPGDFQMGDNFGEGNSDELPVHTVYVGAFYMDVYEITNTQYGKFMDATGHRAPIYWKDSRHNSPNQPIGGVDWDDVVAYANWAGKRLPTEAEWEKAARGSMNGRRYPWGDEISHDNANYKGVEGRDKWEFGAPVGSFQPNGYGLYDMGGNVWEWCSDWFNDFYYMGSPTDNPTGPSSGWLRVARGGSWNSDPKDVRTAYRLPLDPSNRYSGLGFRCVVPAGLEHSVLSSTTEIDTVDRAAQPPVVSDIPGQTIMEGGKFASISLNDYVSDMDNEDSEMIWTYSGNVELLVRINENNIVTIVVPEPEWNGSETFTFTTIDPDGLRDSDTATFTVVFIPDPPVVSDIPDQTIREGESFTSIALDDYVSDPDSKTDKIKWTYSGNTELLVSISGNRIATITTPDIDWDGIETISFTATDPHGFSDSDSATFAATGVNDPPAVFAIPDQIIQEGDLFTRIPLDDYVSDPDNEDSEMVWTHSGNNELSVSISNDRRLSITVSDPCWSGSEVIEFTATDPEGMSDSHSAKFTVVSSKTIEIAPSAVALEIGETQQFSVVVYSANGQICDSDNSDVIWTIEGNIGDIDENGLFVAKIAGDGIVKAALEADDSVIASSSVVVSYPPWDINGDGVVDIADLMIVGNALGKSGEELSADMNNDGIVDMADLVIVAMHYGETIAHGAPSEPNVAISLRAELLENWLSLAKTADDGSAKFRRGIAVLEHLLNIIIPERTQLFQNYPNPFNPDTWIPYQLSKSEDVFITIYDATGRMIKRLDLGHKSAGTYRTKSTAAHWDGRNESGEVVASGVYFILLKAGQYGQMRRIALAK